MRLGKFVEHFKAAAQASDAKGMDPVLKYCAVGRQLGYAGYLALDNITTVSHTEGVAHLWVAGHGEGRLALSSAPRFPVENDAARAKD